MTTHPVPLAWGRDFNNQKRHCFQNDKGERFLNGSLDRRCRTDHDPKLTGATEWLRFIREFGAVAKVAGHPNPFAPDDDAVDLYFLLNEIDGHTTSDGRRTYAEAYLFRTHGTGSWGLNPVFRVFLDNEAGWARVECYDKELTGSCEQALAAVEASYAAVAA
jgi:hypothetical protein